MTETISDCDTETPETMVTVTNGVTITWCPMCDQTPHTTVYKTVYQAVCSTGSTWSLTPTTYTVTESCTGPTPTWNTASSYVPQGFTVTEYECTKCETPGQTVTITEPCGCEATNGTPAPAAATATPASDNNGGSGSPAPGGYGNGGGNGAAATTTPASGGNEGSGSGSGSPPGSGDSNNGGSSPSATTTTVPCDECQETGTPGSGGSGGDNNGGPPPAGYGNSGSTPAGASATASCPGPQCKMGSTATPSGPAAYTGLAPTVRATGLLSAFLVVAGLAVFL